jgi:hypothetical protein
MAPEVLRNGRYTERADIYSFGVVPTPLPTNQQTNKPTNQTNQPTN